MLRTYLSISTVYDTVTVPTIAITPPPAVSHQRADVRTSLRKSTPPKRWLHIMGNGGSESSFGEIAERTMNFLPRVNNNICRSVSKGFAKFLPRRSLERTRGVARRCPLVCVGGCDTPSVGGRCGHNVGLIVPAALVRR